MSAQLLPRPLQTYPMAANGPIFHNKATNLVARLYSGIHARHNGAPDPATQPRATAAATATAQRAARSYACNFFFSNSLSCAGFAFPAVAFMTCPTKKPNSLSLPPR